MRFKRGMSLIFFLRSLASASLIWVAVAVWIVALVALVFVVLEFFR